MIMKRTNFHGVDVILNSLTGDLFEASLRCLADRGRFLELGKFEFLNRTLLDSYMFLKGCSFQGIAFEKVYGNNKFRQQVYELIEEGMLFQFQ